MRIAFAPRIAIVAMVSACLLSGCARTPPEDALRARIDLLQRNIDARDASRVADLLADDFIGNEGLDRRGAQRMAAGVFLRYRKVGAAFGPLQVRMHGDTRATVAFTVAATGSAGGALPSDAQLYDVTTGWRESGGGWQMTSAEWAPRL
jgi:ketosteroid isomerase-like protein